MDPANNSVAVIFSHLNWMPLQYIYRYLDMETVKSFLELMYEKMKDGGRNFEASKYTPPLLRMAHMYDCQELVTACVNGLMENINDANSAEVFNVARLVDSKPLKEAIFARMLEEEDDPMRAVGELSPQEMRELMGAWQNKYKKMKEKMKGMKKKMVCRYCYSRSCKC